MVLAWLAPPKPEVDVRASANPSKPVAVVHYSCICNGIHGLSVVDFEREVMG